MDRQVRPLRIVTGPEGARWLARCVECGAAVQAELEQSKISCACGASLRIALDGVLWGETLEEHR
jgi:hypothetical protein